MSFDEKILIQNFVRKVARSGSCNAFFEVQVVAVEFGLFLNIFTLIRFRLPLLAVQGWDEVDDFVDYLWRWRKSFDSHSGDSRWSSF